MLNKKILMAGASAVAIFAAQAAVPVEAVAGGVTDWNRFYLGAHIGAGQANWDGILDTDNNNNDNNSFVFIDRMNTEGVLAGVQVGYNMMVNNVLFGIEGDFTWMDWEDVVKAVSSTEEVKGEVDALYSIRGRLGVAVDHDQRGVLYATAGVAWADADATVWESGLGSDPGVKFSFDDVGGVVGGGFEWAASDTIRVRAEGLYYWFDDDVDLFAACGDACEADPGDFVKFEDVYVIRVGASMYFNTPSPVQHISMK